MFRRTGFQFARRIADLYSAVYDRYPKSAAGLTMGVGAALCDAFAQRLVDPDRKFVDYDHQRILNFAAYNAVVCGVFWQILYNVIYPKIFRGTPLSVAIQATIVDNFVQTPVVYFPTYYAYKNLAEGGTINDAIQEYRTDGVRMVLICGAVWVPVGFVTFLWCPPQFRVLFNAIVGLGWDVALSYLAPMKTPDAEGSTAVLSSPTE